MKSLFKFEKFCRKDILHMHLIRASAVIEEKHKRVFWQVSTQSTRPSPFLRLSFEPSQQAGEIRRPPNVAPSHSNLSLVPARTKQLIVWLFALTSAIRHVKDGKHYYYAASFWPLPIVGIFSQVLKMQGNVFLNGAGLCTLRVFVLQIHACFCFFLHIHLQSGRSMATRESRKNDT